MGRKFISNVKGIGVKSIVKEYYASTSSSSPTGGEWTDSIPEITNSTFLWSRWKVTLTSGEPTVTEAVQEGIAGAELSNLENTVSELDDDVKDLKEEFENLGDVATEDILPISKGGTGGEDAASARDNLGLGDVATENVLPISKGGTGKTNATDARMNLGIYREFVNGTLWTSENVASGSDAAIIVIPFLRLCFMRAYIVPKRVFAANEQYGVITVPEAYRPAYGHALSIHVGGRVLAKARVVGESGYVYVTPNVETNYEMYITGMWYY